MSLVNITNAEYQQRRHVLEMAAWVNARFRDIDAAGHREAQYFERKGRNVKRLIEEAIPLTRLGLSCWMPGVEPFITLVPEDRNYDGHLEIEGIGPRSLKIEVTTLESDDSTMRRQALSWEGTVNLTGPIRRENGAIVSTPQMIDVAEKADATVELAFARLKAKAESGKYDDNTAMLVYLSEYWPMPPEGKLKLRRRTERYLEMERPPTPAVFYCYWPEHSIESMAIPPRLRSR